MTNDHKSRLLAKFPTSASFFVCLPGPCTAIEFFVISTGVYGYLQGSKGAAANIHNLSEKIWLTEKHFALISLVVRNADL